MSRGRGEAPAGGVKRRVPPLGSLQPPRRLTGTDLLAAPGMLPAALPPRRLAQTGQPRSGPPRGRGMLGGGSAGAPSRLSPRSCPVSRRWLGRGGGLGFFPPRPWAHTRAGGEGPELPWSGVTALLQPGESWSLFRGPLLPRVM